MKHNLFITTFLAASLFVFSLFAGELKLGGDAKEFELVKVISDVPGVFLVYGGDSLVSFNKTVELQGIVAGTTSLQKKDFVVLDDNKTCVFTGKSGIYLVVCATNDANQKLVLQDLIIQIKSEVGPVNPPNPPKPPKPPVVPPTPTILPDGQFKISQSVYDWAKATGDKGVATKLAGVFESVAAKAAAGGFNNESDPVQAMLVDTAAGYKGFITTIWDTWRTNFKNNLKTLNTENKLVTLEQHTTCWIEIALGLKTYGNE